MIRAPSDRVVRLGLALLAFALWSTFAAVHAHVKPADYYVFWEAARHWQAPYDPALITALEARLHITGAWPFVYPPTFLLVAWPFAQLPLALAYPLWTGVSAALFTYAAAHLVKPPWATLALFIVPPVVLAISPGQTSLIVGAALIGGWLNLERRPALAGVLFAVAACVKPQAAVLAPLLMFGHWRVLRWAIIGGLGMVIASCVFGPAVWLEWAQAMTVYRPEIFDRVNPSALAPSPYLQVGLIILGLWFAWTWRDLGGLLIGTFCATPYAHQYDLAALAPIALSWIIDHRRLGWGRAICGAGFLAGFVSTPAGGLVFVLGLAVAAVLERRRMTSPPPLLSQAEAGSDALG
ncbi:MAG TPA: glycosyltransferase family 87 protein [Caulobacteraceae bacterium]|nr:glycosyltransferase family 87 protein [Caulobacteraceae bacterium]